MWFAVAEHGHEFFKVADVPGWHKYDFPSCGRLASRLYRERVAALSLADKAVDCQGAVNGLLR